MMSTMRKLSTRITTTAGRNLSTVIPTVPSGADIILFSFKICPFCCKTKALLHASEVPYSEVEVSPLFKSQLSWSNEYKKVPIAVFPDGEVVNDSSKIMEAILERTKMAEKGNGGSDDEGFASASARKWATWSTEELAVLMYPNMTRTFAECRSALAYIDEAPGISAVDALLTKTLGALGMTLAHGKIKAKRNIVDERAALAEALDKWCAKLHGDEKGGPFLGGATPNLGDVSVLGVLAAADGVPLREDIAAHGDGKLRAWIDAMNATIPQPKVVPYIR